MVLLIDTNIILDVFYVFATLFLIFFAVFVT